MLDEDRTECTFLPEIRPCDSCMANDDIASDMRHGDRVHLQCLPDRSVIDRVHGHELRREVPTSLVIAYDEVPKHTSRTLNVVHTQ